jgi:hypothetical protein
MRRLVTYTSDETGACVRALACRILEHVRLEQGEARVVVKHGDATRLVEALRSGGMRVTVDIASRAASSLLTLEVVVNGESTFGLCNVAKRVTTSGGGISATMTIEVDYDSEVGEPGSELRATFVDYAESDLSTQLDVPREQINVTAIARTVAKGIRSLESVKVDFYIDAKSPSQILAALKTVKLLGLETITTATRVSAPPPDMVWNIPKIVPGTGVGADVADVDVGVPTEITIIATDATSVVVGGLDHTEWTWSSDGSAVTISGTPKAAGFVDYTVTASNGVTAAATSHGTITAWGPTYDTSVETVMVGAQMWAARNYGAGGGDISDPPTTYRDGTEILRVYAGVASGYEATTHGFEACTTERRGVWAYTDPAAGRMFNGYVNFSALRCPEGFRVASMSDFAVLRKYTNGSTNAETATELESKSFARVGYINGSGADVFRSTRGVWWAAESDATDEKNNVFVVANEFIGAHDLDHAIPTTDAFIPKYGGYPVRLIRGPKPDHIVGVYFVATANSHKGIDDTNPRLVVLYEEDFPIGIIFVFQSGRHTGTLRCAGSNTSDESILRALVASESCVVDGTTYNTSGQNGTKVRLIAFEDEASDIITRITGVRSVVGGSLYSELHVWQGTDRVGIRSNNRRADIGLDVPVGKVFRGIRFDKTNNATLAVSGIVYPPRIVLISGTTDQTVTPPITPIVFTTLDATRATVDGLEPGAYEVSQGAVTITGPTTPGVYPYTVTASNSDGSTVSVTGVLTVSPGTFTLTSGSDTHTVTAGELIEPIVFTTTNATAVSASDELYDCGLSLEFATQSDTQGTVTIDGRPREGVFTFTLTASTRDGSTDSVSVVITVLANVAWRDDGSEYKIIGQQLYIDNVAFDGTFGWVGDLAYAFFIDVWHAIYIDPVNRGLRGVSIDQYSDVFPTEKEIQNANDWRHIHPWTGTGPPVYAPVTLTLTSGDKDQVVVVGQPITPISFGTNSVGQLGFRGALHPNFVASQWRHDDQTLTISGTPTVARECTYEVTAYHKTNHTSVSVSGTLSVIAA